MKDLVTRAEDELGPIDILVNNAGIMYYTSMKNAKEDLWEKMVDINCKVITDSLRLLQLFLSSACPPPVLNCCKF